MTKLNIKIHILQRFTNYWVKRKNDQKISKKEMDIAKSAQLVYENILFNLLNKLYDKYKIKNLTLSGGCAMNSVANGKILKNTPFENYIFLQIFARCGWLSRISFSFVK